MSEVQVDTPGSAFCVPDETARPAASRFARSLTTLVDAAESRVQSLQEEAQKRFLDHEEGIRRFCDVAGHIQSLLLSRLAEFRSVRAFSDVIQNESRERSHADDGTFHGLTTVLTVPVSPNRPTSMELSFRIGHDGHAENVVLDYRFSILPIFVSFDSHDQLTVPMTGADDAVITEWIQQHLIAFTSTYYEVYFHEQYQRPTLTIDPVLNIRFPKAMAVSDQEYCGSRYYFYTDESQRRFRLHPESYTGDSES